MAAEKGFDVKSLIEKGKAKGSLTNADILEALEDEDLDIDQMEKIYEAIEASGVEITGSDAGGACG